MEAKDMNDMPESEFRQWVVGEFQMVRKEVADNTELTKSVAEDTAFIRAAWAEGITAVRFFCRLAAAWRFLLKQVFLPIGFPALALYGAWYYSEFHRFPVWLSDCFKFLMAVV